MLNTNFAAALAACMLKSSAHARLLNGAAPGNCEDDWVYEECSDRYWLACNTRDVSDCGWWYATDDDEEWVTCEDWGSWESCNGSGDYTYDDTCDEEWSWEGCSGLFWKNECEEEYCSEGGWWYSTPSSKNNNDTFWVNCQDWESWASCNSQDEEPDQVDVDELINRWQVGFRVTDTNNDGLMDLSELWTLLSWMPEVGLKTEEQAEEAQAGLAEQHPDGLTWEELQTVIHGMVAGGLYTYRDFEKEITVIEDHLIAKVLSDLEKIDADQDGRISEAEAQDGLDQFDINYPTSIGEHSPERQQIIDWISDDSSYTVEHLIGHVIYWIGDSPGLRERLISDAADIFNIFED